MKSPNEAVERILEDTERSRAVFLSLLEDQHLKVNELKESQLKYESLFENNPVSLWEEDFSEVKNFLDKHCSNANQIEAYLDKNPEKIYELVSLVKIVDVNLATLKLYKADSKNQLFDGLINVFTIDSFRIFKNLILNIWQNKFELETETINKNLAGEIIHIKIKYAVLPGYEATLSRIIVSIIDITEEKEIKDRLIQSEQRYLEAQSIARFGNWHIDYKTNLVTRSPEIYNILGINKHELNPTYDAFIQLVHKDDIKSYQEVFETSIKDQKPYEHSYRIITHQGETKYILEKGFTYCNENNEPLRTVGTAQDITEKYLSEIQLKESQLEYQVLFDNAPIALFEEDFTEVIKKLYELGAHEENINHLLDDQNLLEQCLRLVFVNNINQEALKLFKAEDKNHFHQALPNLFSKHSVEIVKNIFIDITKGKSKGIYETTLKMVDGEVFNAIVRYSILKYKKDSGKLIFSVENITIRKKLLADIEEQQLNLNQAQQIALIGSFTLNHADKSIVRTDEFYRIFEASTEELPALEESFLKFIHPDDKDQLVKTFHNSKDEIKPYEFTYRIYTGKGNLKYIHEKGNTYTDDKGNPLKTIGTLQDITEKVFALRKIEEAQTIINNSTLVAFLWKFEKNWPVEYVSENVIKLLEYPAIDFYESKIRYMEFIHPEEIERVKKFEEQSKALAEKNDLNFDTFTHEPYRIITKSGHTKWVLDKTIVRRDSNNNITHFQGFIEDITEKHFAEQELEKTHQVLENTLTTITEGFFTLDTNWIYTYVNPQAAKLLGYSIEELLHNNIWDIDPSAIGGIFHEKCQEAVEKQKPIIYNEYYHQQNIWFENRIYPSNEGLSIFFNDITERFEVEKKLKEAHNIIINSSSIAIIWENTPTWPIKYISENVERILGYSSTEMKNEIIHFSKIMHPDDLEISNEEVFSYLNDDTINQYELTPYRVFTKNGKIRWIKERTQINRDENKAVIELRGFMDDVTEQYQLESGINSILNSVSKLTGHEYLRELTIQLSNVLGAEHTFIGLNASENPLLITTLFNSYKGEIVENFSYNLEGTPCADVLSLEACSFPNNVANLFPEDTLLKEMEIQGYVGVPLIDSQNQSIGIVAGLFKNPIENTHFTESIIQLFSTRLSAELERLNTEAKLKKAELEFNKQLQKLNKAIDSVNDVVFMTDTNGVFTYVNEYFTKLYGYQPEELIGKVTPRILKSGIRNEEDYQLLWSTLLSKKQFNLVLKNKHKAGHLIDIESSLTSITNDNDEIIGFVAIQRDITERKTQEQKLAESEEEGWALFENSPNMIWIEDYSKIKLQFVTLRKNGITDLRTYLDENPQEIKKLGELVEVKKVNKRSLEFYEVKTQEELFRKITDFFIEESYYGFKEELISLFEGKLIYSSEVPIRKLNGQIAYLSINITIPENNKENLDKVIISFNDITDKKRNEQTKEILLNITKQISDVTSVEEFSTVIKSELSNLIDTSNFYLALYNKDKNTFSIPYFADELDKEFGDKHEFDTEGTLTGYVIKNKKPLLATMEVFKNLEKSGIIRLVGSESQIWLGVPLFNKNDVIGAIAVQSYTNQHAFNNNDLKILEIVSSQIAIAIDRIQQQNTIKENEEKFRSIFELSPDMVNLVDINGYLLNCNHQFIKQLGYESKEEILNINCINFIAKEDRALAFEKFKLCFVNSQVYNQEFKLIRKDGSSFAVEISATLNYDENNVPKNIIAITRDVTLRKQHELEITNALEKAKEADRLKSAFLANMSHEIRTPMNGILGFAEMLQNHDLNEEKRSFYANIIMNSSRQLLSIINDVLDMSTIEAGLVEIKEAPVSINEMLTELYEFFLQKSDEKQLKLSCNLTLSDDLSVINTDQTKVQQVLTNFISNAIKFTKKGEVAFGYTFKDNFLEFYVSDTGIGIDKKLHLEIFERFRQVNLEYTRETIGNGLGLSISKKLVELLGGEIWLESEPNKGSTFYFTLPYKHDVLNITNDINTPTIAQKTMNEQITILLAEDEEYNRIFIEEILDDKNFTILTAENGVEAVDIAKNHSEIMFVLMDIKMPIMNGIEASKLIREFNKNVPIIALTAFSMESDKIHLLNEGFDDYISKPIVKKDLMQILDKYLTFNNK